MSRWQTPLSDIVIPNGTADSNEILLAEYVDAISIGIIGPAALDAFVFTLVVSDVSGGTFVNLEQVVGTDAAPPLVAKARVYAELVNFPVFRIHSSSNVAAARTWKAFKYWET